MSACAQKDESSVDSEAVRVLQDWESTEKAAGREQNVVPMCTCAVVCVCACVCTYVVCICVYMHVCCGCACVCPCGCVCVHTYICVPVRLWVTTCVQVHVHMWLCMCIVPAETKKGCQIPGTGVRDDCELPNGCWKSKSQSSGRVASVFNH